VRFRKSLRYLSFEQMFDYATRMHTWERHDSDFNRPIAAPLDRCAELLGVDLATVRRAATAVEPYVRVDGVKVWSLMQLERQLRPEAFGRVRGGYISRRRVRASDG
jgi:hypothetical protein